MSYRVAVIGAGLIAGNHLAAVHEMDQLEAVAIADLVLEKAERIAAGYGLSAYADYKEMISKEKPDIAIITLPHYLHKEAAVYCARQGCHLLLEKPMAMNIAECDEIIAAVDSAQVKLLVGHFQHYLAENRKAKELVDSGILGKLVMINDLRHADYFQDSRPGWFFDKAKAGGGILANLGSHSVDKIQWLSGGKVCLVKAVLSDYGTKGDIEGSGLVFLQMENGVSATIAQSGYPGAYRNETELVFTGGMLKLLTGKGLWISEQGEYRQVQTRLAIEPFRLQLETLLAYIGEAVEPECSMAYSRSVVSVIEHIYRSHEEERELYIK